MFIIDDYKFAMPYPERFMVDTRPLEEILEEEENWEWEKNFPFDKKNYFSFKIKTIKVLPLNTSFSNLKLLNFFSWVHYLRKKIFHFLKEYERAEGNMNYHKFKNCIFSINSFLIRCIINKLFYDLKWSSNIPVTLISK